MTADTITAIKKALETLKQPKSMSMYTTQNDMISDLMKERRLSVEALESLQRENERLTGLIRDNGTPRFNAVCERAETAEADVKRMREALEKCQRVLAMFIDPAHIVETSVVNAYAHCVDAETSARADLSSTGDTHGN